MEIKLISIEYVAHGANDDSATVKIEATPIVELTTDFAMTEVPDIKAEIDKLLEIAKTSAEKKLALDCED